ncbi:MAG TPA: indolepyruvate oxidoreductase subunit beta [Thermoplasmata archaeon]|nr:indolepyruvate oxidoreductase subunit beta [Thermoplasmata archaeon]
MKGVGIVVGGVGGQGVILVARVLAEAALARGLRAQMSEVHGMSQRGGSVVSHVRFGDVESPLVKKGEADAVVGFEPLETVRLLPWVHRKSVVVTGLTPVRPLSVFIGKEAYPPVEDLLREAEERAGRVIAVDADGVARSIGEPVVASAVLLGALMGTRVPPVPMDRVRETLRARVPPRLVAANLEALDIGYGIAVEDEHTIQFA